MRRFLTKSYTLSVMIVAAPIAVKVLCAMIEARMTETMAFHII